MFSTPLLFLGVGCADSDELDDGISEAGASSGGETEGGSGGKSGAGNGGKNAGGGSAGASEGGDAGMSGAAGEGAASGVAGGGSGGVGGSAGGTSGGGSGGGGGGTVPVVGDSYAATSAGRLLFFERASGSVASSVAITGLAAAEQILGIDFRPAVKKLYALSSSGKLYTLDAATGVATLASTLIADAADTTSPFSALSGAAFGVDFNPVADRLRVVSDTGQNLRINVDTGATTTDGALSPGTPVITGAAYTNDFASACRTALYVLDTATGKLLLQNPPNEGTLTAVGDLGLSGTASASGFEIVTSASGQNAAIALLTVNNVTSLYDIDLSKGTASGARALALAAGEQVRGLSVPSPAVDPAQARGELVGVSISNRLISFERSAPSKLCTTLPITGLAAGENVLGIDGRPTDGLLYGLASTGKLYTFNLDSGAAVLKSTLSADPADASDAFTGLSGADFGVGFNPVPDRLRVASSTGQNLRINVDTGAVITDSTLSPGTPQISALAYSNSFAGAKSTTLFAIASSTGTLTRIGGDPATGGACPADVNNPNCGVVTPINLLGTGALAAVDGFDIDPRTGIAGSALAAFSTGTASTSSLYAIDLASGVASAPAGVANATIGGGERLRGLALLVNPTLSAFGIANNRLVGFALSTPSTLTLDVAITGLQVGETVLGIDFRPLDGLLYALGSSGRLYTLDVITGAATLRASLTAAVGDDNPFTALKAGAAYGVDFNPAADLLRAVSDGRDNLRIVPSARTITVAQLAGATFTDADLNPGTPSVVGAAYTNNYAGTGTTTLFGIDAVTNELVRQGGPDAAPSPNGGLITSVGALGVDVVGDAGFDIVGGRNGLALATFRTTGNSSELYSINLSTGAATAFNATGNTVGTAAVTPPVRGLAVQLR